MATKHSHLHPDPTDRNLADKVRACDDTQCFKARFVYWLLGLLTDRANHCRHGEPR